MRGALIAINLACTIWGVSFIFQFTEQIQRVGGSVASRNPEAGVSTAAGPSQTSDHLVANFAAVVASLVAALPAILPMGTILLFAGGKPKGALGCSTGSMILGSIAGGSMFVAGFFAFLAALAAIFQGSPASTPEDTVTTAETAIPLLGLIGAWGLFVGAVVVFLYVTQWWFARKCCAEDAQLLSTNAAAEGNWF